MRIQEAFGSFLTRVADGLAEPISSIIVGGSARNIVVEFRRTGATSPHTAQRFHPTGRVQARAFVWLMDLEVIRQPTPGRYYVDEEKLFPRPRTRHFQ
jgi:hypothetical protein